MPTLKLSVGPLSDTVSFAQEAAARAVTDTDFSQRRGLTRNMTGRVGAEFPHGDALSVRWCTHTVCLGPTQKLRRPSYFLVSALVTPRSAARAVFDLSGDGRRTSLQLAEHRG